MISTNITVNCPFYSVLLRSSIVPLGCEKEKKKKKGNWDPQEVFFGCPKAYGVSGPEMRSATVET